jgi:hypothetical protein
MGLAASMRGRGRAAQAIQAIVQAGLASVAFLTLRLYLAVCFPSDIAMRQRAFC